MLGDTRFFIYQISILYSKLLGILNSQFVCAAAGAAAGAWGATHVIIYFDNRKQDKINFGLINMGVTQLWATLKMLLNTQAVFNPMHQELIDQTIAYSENPDNFQPIFNEALCGLDKPPFIKIHVSDLQTLFSNDPPILKKITIFSGTQEAILMDIENRNQQVRKLKAEDKDPNILHRVMGLQYEREPGIPHVDGQLLSRSETLKEHLDFTVKLLEEILRDIEKSVPSLLPQSYAKKVLTREILEATPF